MQTMSTTNAVKQTHALTTIPTIIIIVVESNRIDENWEKWTEYDRFFEPIKAISGDVSFNATVVVIIIIVVVVNVVVSFADNNDDDVGVSFDDIGVNVADIIAIVVEAVVVCVVVDGVGAK